ncbi:respiratory nitrate reductase subunit gamma [Kangiella koreensis]|uniref:nitrate reductase (quinone) n=1 Tax=Kangiella koreensis (strain DSM 16069 / JCM 12317 / KCTC 12182 / SW-125) TaxID=523791 RepID=C7RBW1_KANKD|nr:respiratory nitrate reductase subunit gamma [Kangiella koreensis]ACV26753.1 respiratory nitrate reductase, gamma subunit [Kangiella koreensis DSM 16069]
MSNFNTLLFGIYPYIAIAICIVGCWIRFDREPYTWKAHSSQMLSNKGMRMASIFFHVGVIFILLGHFVGLLLPEAIYHYFISTADKQLLAMVSGGFFGIICLIGLVMLIHRRLTNDRVRANSSKSDIFILFLLLVQLVLGLMTIAVSSQHMDGSVMVQLANWAQSIVTFQGFEAAAYIANVHIIYKLHVFVGMTMILVFPFTRLVHIISMPIWYFGRKYQVVRQR